MAQLTMDGFVEKKDRDNSNEGHRSPRIATVDKRQVKIEDLKGVVVIKQIHRWKKLLESGSQSKGGKNSNISLFLYEMGTISRYLFYTMKRMRALGALTGA